LIYPFICQFSNILGFRFGKGKKNPPFGLFAPPIHFDQIIILDKSISTQSFWLGVMDKKKCNFEKIM
jgi:hypothetical protein